MHAVLSVSIDFPSYSQRDTLFHGIAYDYSRADWDGLFEMFYGRISLNSVFLLLVLNFVKGFELELIYISLMESIRSSLTHFHGLTAACAAVIVHRNHFFVCTKRMNLLNLKLNSDRLVIIVETFLKLPNLHMLIKQKGTSLLRNLALRTFGKLSLVFSTKVNMLHLLYSIAHRCCLLHLIKQNCLLKIVLRTTLILITQVSLHLFCLLELI